MTIVLNGTGEILKKINPERRIAFAVNTEGKNKFGFIDKIAEGYWPEIVNIGPTELGKVLTKKVDDVEFYALCCYSRINGWKNPKEVIKKCFDSIPGNAPVATIAIGTGFVGFLTGADFGQIRQGMEESDKQIILYS